MRFVSALSGGHTDAWIKIEKIFFEEYLPKASGEYIKVYLYGLRMACSLDTECSLTDCARALRMEEEKVVKAFTYWIRFGLIEREGDVYTYCDVAEKMAGNGKKKMPPRMLNRYADFHCELQALFPDRILQPRDYEYAHDWVELLHLPEEVVLMLIRYATEKRRPDRGSLSMAYIDRIAQDWAKGEIDTAEKAEEFLITHDTKTNRPVQKLLTDLGLSRLPTRAEIDLYNKWRDEWGFDEKAIKAAAAGTAYVRNPNFTHIDELLDRLRTDAKRPFEVELLRSLGIERSSATAGEKELLRQWYAMGATDELILYATRKTLTLRNPTTYHVDKIVRHWIEQGITDTEAAEALWQRETEAKKQKNGQKSAGEFAQRSVTAEELARDITDIDRLMENENKK